jgi:lysophospholipase L1-like esterase
MLKKICLLVFALGMVISAFPQNKTIAIFGSSVAKGTGDTTGNGGYSGIIRDTLEKRGWEVVNVSKGGDNTIKIAPRFESDLLPVKAKYVLIGLSLGNEGIVSDVDLTRKRVFEQFRSNLIVLIKRCRDAGMIPVIVNCYARSDFKSEQYAAVKAMNLVINTWDLPSINVLGTIDNGNGNWETGYVKDRSHPNVSGHREMYYGFVPSLFDALESGKPMPLKYRGNSYVQIGAKGSDAPLTYSPGRDSIHSFTYSMQVKTTDNGTIASIKSKTNNPHIRCKDDTIIYRSSNGIELTADTTSENKGWQYVLLTHRYASHLTLFYVNGVLAGTVNEFLQPEEFITGGSGNSSYSPPLQAAYRDLLIYRSSLNPEEVKALYYGQILQSSLEIYAPLNDTAFISGSTISNLAQSLSEIRVAEGELTSKQAKK